MSNKFAEFEVGDRVQYVGDSPILQGDEYVITDITGNRISVSSHLTTLTYWSVEFFRRNFVVLSNTDVEEQAAECTPEPKSNLYAHDGTGYIEIAGTNDMLDSGNDKKDFSEFFNEQYYIDGYSYPAGFTRRHGAAPECDHEYETKYLFTSHYDVCTKCGKEKEEK